MGWLFIVFATLCVHTAQGLVCPACEECPSPPENCPGGLALDRCDCCIVCAKVTNQTCGGKYGLNGKCDTGLICAISPEHGSAISDNEIGICQECEESFDGCTIVGSTCVCDTSCSDIFKYADEASCLNALSYNVNSTVTESNCTGVQCGVMFMPQCPPDSLPLRQEMESCCPAPPTCHCQMDICTRQTCAPGFDLTLLRGGLGQPGRCCDEFECTPPENECQDIHCPLDELAEMECPLDSYRLPSLVTSNGCCELHQGCQCISEDLCPAVECESDDNIRVVAPALGQPGFCCPKYECVNATTQSCIHEGIEFQHEETWKLDKCTTCTCKGGLMFCKVALCEDQPRCDWMGVPEGECCPVCLGCISTYGKLFENNETWHEDDYCTSCRCEKGQLHCIASSCMVNCHNPRKVPGQCCPVCDDPDIVSLPPQCPPLTNCSLMCIEGLIRDDSGCQLCQCKPEQCDLQCPNGLITDIDGQEICECAPVVKECPPIDTCYKQCPYGLKRSKNGCLRCKCNKCPPFTCKKLCPGMYAKNEEGCKLCRCAGMNNTTTSTPSTTAIDTSTRVCMSSDGRQFDDGESWSDGCRTCFCHASREMCMLLNCPVPSCIGPVIKPGDCCPSCPDKPMKDNHSLTPATCQSVDGVFRIEGDVWQLDKCTQCLCHNGRVLCDSERCPPLLCSHPVLLPDRCCPLCPGDTTEVLDPSVLVKSCVSRNHSLYTHGDIWRVNPCQSCMCQYGQIMCYSQTCPVLDCDDTSMIVRKGQCCPVCAAARQEEVCQVNDLVFRAGEVWQEDECTQCECTTEGRVSCTTILCEMLNCVNPVKVDGQCCPVCPGSMKFHHDDADSAEQEEGTKTNSIALICTAAIAVLFAIVIIVLVAVLFHRRYRRRHRPQAENIATLVAETKRPKSTNLDLQGIMPLLTVDNSTNKNMTNNCYDSTGNKTWSSEVEKNNSDNIEKTKEELLKEQLYEDDIDMYKHIQSV